MPTIHGWRLIDDPEHPPELGFEFPEEYNRRRFRARVTGYLELEGQFGALWEEIRRPPPRR